MSCYSESDIVPVVLKIIENNPGIRTSGIIAEARRIMKPSGEDLEILNNRNDDKFSQKVRNIKSHKTIISMVDTTDEVDCRWYLKK